MARPLGQPRLRERARTESTSRPDPSPPMGPDPTDTRATVRNRQTDRNLRRLPNYGYTIRQIAEHLGVHYSMISRRLQTLERATRTAGQQPEQTASAPRSNATPARDCKTDALCPNHLAETRERCSDGNLDVLSHTKSVTRCRVLLRLSGSLQSEPEPPAVFHWAGRVPRLDLGASGVPLFLGLLQPAPLRDHMISTGGRQMHGCGPG